MIVYQSALASAIAAVYPLTNARIGYQNYLRGLSPTAITASSEDVTNAPKDAPLRPDTAEYWQPTSLPATWLIDLGSTKTIDYIGIAGHTLGSSGSTLRTMFTLDANAPDPYLLLPGTTGNYASTPDSANNSVVGDLTLTVGVAADDFTPAAISTLLNKWTTSGNQRAYMLQVLTDGKLRYSWSTNGTAVTSKDSTVSAGATDSQKIYLKVTHDVDNGLAGNDVKFWKSIDGGLTWSQIGATVTTAGTTNIFDSTAALIVGGNDVGATERLAGKVFYASVRSGIDGILKAVMDANDPSDGAASWVSSATLETWTVATSGSPTARINNDVIGTANTGYAPTDDTPIMLVSTPKTGRYLHLRITGGSAVPRIAVIYAGVSLAMAKAVSGPYAPISMSRDTVLMRSMSRSGQFLGQSYRRNGVVSSATFKNLDDAWVRANFNAFSKSARQYPYFFAWNPSLYPTEVGYVWTEKDIIVKYNGTINLMDVTFEMRGIGT
jgi:hypothetical protein